MASKKLIAQLRRMRDRIIANTNAVREGHVRPSQELYEVVESLMDAASDYYDAVSLVDMDRWDR